MVPIFKLFPLYVIIILLFSRALRIFKLRKTIVKVLDSSQNEYLKLINNWTIENEKKYRMIKMITTFVFFVYFIACIQFSLVHIE